MTPAAGLFAGDPATRSQIRSRFTPAQLGLIDEAAHQERESAIDAGSIGFMARMLVRVTMPHSKPGTDRFIRSNGGFTVLGFRDRPPIFGLDVLPYRISAAALIR